jgi:hypothetical protein
MKAIEPEIDAFDKEWPEFDKKTNHLTKEKFSKNKWNIRKTNGSISKLK